MYRFRHINIISNKIFSNFEEVVEFSRFIYVVCRIKFIPSNSLNIFVKNVNDKKSYLGKKNRSRVCEHQTKINTSISNDSHIHPFMGQSLQRYATLPLLLLLVTSKYLLTKRVFLSSLN